MYTIPKSKQTSFIYGPEIYEKLILKDHLLYKLDKKLDFSFINEVCQDLYSPNIGRPVTNTPERMLRSAVVQYLYDYSDRQMEYEAQVNIMVKWFVGLNIEDTSYDHSALGDFRNKLGESKWNEVFSCILKQIEDAGFSKGTQYIDATHVVANIAIPGTIGLIRQGITGVLKSLKKVDHGLYKELGGKKQAIKREKVHDLKPEEKEKRLVAIVKEAKHVIKKTEHFDKPVEEKVEVLKRILNENIEEDEDKVQKRKGKVKDRLVSTVDTDARHGAKSDKKKFVGYKVNSTMSEDGFITNVKATPGNSYDGDVLLPLIDENMANGQTIEKVAADGAYGSVDNRFEMLKRDAVLVAPVRKNTNPAGLYTQEKFSIEETGVTCPAGRRTMISNHNKKTGDITFFFKKEVCQQCDLRQKCTKQDRRTITISKHYPIMEEAKRYSECKDYKDDLRMRAHIEPKQAEMKRFHGLKRAKYWSLGKLNIQATLTAIAVNVKRFITVNSDSYRKVC